METQITLSEASAKLTQLCEKVVGDRDVVIIQRPDGENVALIAADELDSLMETVHLLRSPANAVRLLTELQQAKTRTLKPQSVNELRQELGLDTAE
jgi:antitoxin YefM